jgi:LmbE family N-acetylglucosaminyl deacetylase
MQHEQKKSRTAAVIVAHPDDETLWAGGAILERPSWNWFIMTLCRASDKNRAPRFFTALKVLGASGNMGDLDDSPELKPLAEQKVQAAILQLLPQKNFDIIISHDPSGEYTRHIRHEETGRAVRALWHAGKITARELWTFAYEDSPVSRLPQAIRTAPLYRMLPEKIWRSKYSIITETYGFAENSFEAATTPRAEAFRRFANPGDSRQRLNDEGATL